MKAWCRRSGRETVAIVVVMVALATGLQACAAFQKALPFLPNADGFACLETEVDKGTPALTIIGKCGFAADALGFVETFIVGHKKAARMRVGAILDGVQYVDAGADAK